MVKVESLDQEGRGIAHVEGKVIFIDGALPGETVTYTSYRKKATYEFAQLERVVHASALRTRPRCRHFGNCGGCSLQHLDARAQVAIKQRILEDNLSRIGKVQPEMILPAIHGESWGYRHRARFSARYVAKKGGTLIGFHEKRSSYVADMTSCAVIPPRISALLTPLRELLNSLTLRDRMPQLELAVGETSDALVLRILDPLPASDERTLREFAARHRILFFLQPKGPQSVIPLSREHADTLFYRLPEFDLRMGFSPTEFTQINSAVNAVLVRRAIALLAPRSGERIADMFCGVGNFALPIARSGANVVGVEASAGLVTRASSNAIRNGLESSAQFVNADLYRAAPVVLPNLGHLDRMLIDPPRDGAVALIKALESRLKCIVYVSCNPATLARDAGVLVHEKGYRMTAAGVVNMFAHTSHVESIAVFES